ncbi:SpoIIE family protein phosphatase [Pseudonocardia sp. ICBG1293]|uniref:ATP-binding SpoIIE family protein phosphatase n=1 Tax=Pseudonocardia sp. ICBG1293 TaxID=2844382 RepID=UPI001CCE7024|nr:SpoIIE family protein phosphatase [Pseudonocardia sp. ICBG1293]
MSLVSDDPVAVAAPSSLRSPARLAAVRATRLFDTGPEEAFNRLTRLVAVVLGTPTVTLTVVDEMRTFLKGTPDPVHVVGPDGVWSAPVEDSGCKVVVEYDDEICAGDVAADPRLRDLPLMTGFGAAAWLGVPVHDPDGQVVGNLCAMDVVVREWTALHRETIRTLADAVEGEIALRLSLRRTERQALAAARAAAETEALARTLQESLLPAQPLRLPGVDIAARFLPGGTGVEVMGDFYDAVPTPDGVAVVIGDVQGKGAAAARTTALARSATRTAAHFENDPAAVLRTVNDVLHVWFDGRVSFVTAALASLRRGPADTWRADLASAGHPPALVRRADGSAGFHGGGGLVLGIGITPIVAGGTVTLAPGDSLVLYTDGITEAHTRGHWEQLGEEGARRTLAALPPDADADTIARALTGAALAHCGTHLSDDAGVVVVRVEEPGTADGDDRVVTEYDPHPRAGREARRSAERVLTGWGLAPATLADAMLVIEELVANVVDHARTAFRLTLVRGPGALRIEVDDDGTGSPSIQPVDPRAARGRGLQLVDAVARAWGHHTHGRGTRVWAEFAAR